jgi:hypothetical protein
MKHTFKIAVNERTGKVGLIPTSKQGETYLRKRVNICDEIVVEFSPKIDPEVNKKFHELVSKISKHNSSIPEKMERFFFGDEVQENDYIRHDIIRKRIFKEIGVTNIQEIDLGGEKLHLKTPKHTAEIGDKISYQDVYNKTKDWIFTQLRKYGWNEVDLERQFECLYFGVTQEEYELIKRSNEKNKNK